MGHPPLPPRHGTPSLLLLWDAGTPQADAGRAARWWLQGPGVLQGQLAMGLGQANPLWAGPPRGCAGSWSPEGLGCPWTLCQAGGVWQEGWGGGQRWQPPRELAGPCWEMERKRDGHSLSGTIVFMADDRFTRHWSGAGKDWAKTRCTTTEIQDHL